MSHCLRALFIDPFADETEMYATFLGLRGFDVQVSDDVDEGCCTALSKVPDVIVARLRQARAEVSGLDVLDRVKHDPTTESIPVVILSTSILPRDEQAAVAGGCAGYVRLPCTPEDLASELRRVVRRVHREATPPRRPRRLLSALRRRSRQQ
jgi:two-component system cell cycle response regulator DivK